MIIVLDAGALINNENFTFTKQNKYYTTSLVLEEWKDYRTKSLSQNAIKNKILRIKDPKEENMKKAKEECKKIGLKMQEADLSILALATEIKEKKRKLEVMTDDYSLQNILKKNSIKFTTIAQPGIKKVKKFKS